MRMPVAHYPANCLSPAPRPDDLQPQHSLYALYPVPKLLKVENIWLSSKKFSQSWVVVVRVSNPSTREEEAGRPLNSKPARSKEEVPPPPPPPRPKKISKKTRCVVHTCNSSTWVVEAEGGGVQGYRVNSSPAWATSDTFRTQHSGSGLFPQSDGILKIKPLD